MDNQETGTVKTAPKKKFFTKKKIIWTAIILLVVGFIVYKVKSGGSTTGNIQTDTVKKQDLQLTVLATGQVVSSTDLNLSFKTTGVVSKINVTEGDKVKAGQVLATLDQSSQSASLTSARGSVAQAEAAYQKVLAGSSSANVAVAQVNLTNAQASLANTQKQQQVLVNNAYSTLLNSTLSAVAGPSNSDSVVATVSGTYTGQSQGIYNFTIYSTGSGFRFKLSGLETADGQVSTSPQPLGTNGLFIQFSSNVVSSNDSWNITIPNTQAANYVANYNSYQSALQTQTAQVTTAQNAVAAAQAALNVQTAQPQPADVAAAQAQILVAQGQLQSAQAAYDNTIITAPADGTITSVDTKVGQQAAALSEAIVLQDVSNLHIGADVSEANIATVQPGQTVDVTFDALGPDRHFNATVLTVDPASTVVSGVVNYLVKATLPQISDIKPGMTANMTILVAKKSGVLSVPSSAIINQSNNQYVRVVDDVKKGTYHQVQVQTGLNADGGLVEITSGLSEGQTVVTYLKQ
jgi:HlyD family secretion protein